MSKNPIERVTESGIDLQRSISRIHTVSTTIIVIIIAIAASVAVIECVHYVRKDNDRTRNLICGIAQQVNLKTEDCKE